MRQAFDRMGLLHKFACADADGAFDLWREPVARQGSHPLVHAVVLAASAHNSQPWQFSVSEGAIEMRANPNRHMGSFDPYLKGKNLVHAAPGDQGFFFRVLTVSGTRGSAGTGLVSESTCETFR